MNSTDPSTASQNKMRKNQAIFRYRNEDVQRGMDNLNKLADEANQESHSLPDGIEVHFYCECADEDCTARIPIEPKVYRKIHTDRSKFIVLPGHEVEYVEDVIKRTPTYTIVQKLQSPIEADAEDKLEDTDNNS